METSTLPQNITRAINQIAKVCESGRSDLFEYGSAMYKDSVRHFLASSSEVAQVAVQPGSPDDLGKINLKAVHPKIKGGGHAMAPTYSSTSGIQISMARFASVKYDKSSTHVEVGAGCLWEQVYFTLAKYGRNVIGGSSSQGVGVGGWLLGGGYSLKSNKHGLGIDNIVAYELVKPDGSFLHVTEGDKDLFNALRGGGNNFGIVTKFTLKTHEQTATYGASFAVEGTRSEDFKKALSKFVEEEKRQEAVAIGAFRHILNRGQVEYNIGIFCVFDAPKPTNPAEVPFQQFKDLASSGSVWVSDPAGWELGKIELLEDLTYLGPSGGGQWDEKEGEKGEGDEGDEGDHADHGGLPSFFQERSMYELYGLASGTYEDLIRPIITADMAEEADEADEEEEHPDQLNVGAKSEKKVDAARAESLKDDPRPEITKKVDNVGELNVRGRFSSFMLSRCTKELLDKMEQVAKDAASLILGNNGRAVVIDAWPVHHLTFSQSPPGAAWPHHPNQPFGPLLLYFQWDRDANDDFWLLEMEKCLVEIYKFALEKELTKPEWPRYSNLSVENVTAKQIYQENLGWLGSLRGKIDPEDVMGLCAGQRIPLIK